MSPWGFTPCCGDSRCCGTHTDTSTWIPGTFMPRQWTLLLWNLTTKTRGRASPRHPHLQLPGQCCMSGDGPVGPTYCQCVRAAPGAQTDPRPPHFLPRPGPALPTTSRPGSRTPGSPLTCKFTPALTLPSRSPSLAPLGLPPPARPSSPAHLGRPAAEHLQPTTGCPPARPWALSPHLSELGSSFLLLHAAV